MKRPAITRKDSVGLKIKGLGKIPHCIECGAEMSCPKDDYCNACYYELTTGKTLTYEVYGAAALRGEFYEY